MTPVPEEETSDSLRTRPKQEAEVRRRQRERARIMGLLLGAFALLLFLISMAKIAVNQ